MGNECVKGSAKEVLCRNTSQLIGIVCQGVREPGGGPAVDKLGDELIKQLCFHWMLEHAEIYHGQLFFLDHAI